MTRDWHEHLTRGVLVGALVGALGVVGCTTTPVRQDGLRVAAAVNSAVDGELALPVSGARPVTPARPVGPWSLSQAVQWTLLENPQVSLQLARLDGAQAERVQAGLLRNPMLSLMALRPTGGGRYELDYGLMQGLSELLTRSRRRAAADAAQRRTEMEVVLQLVRLAQDTEEAYAGALLAQAQLRLQQKQLLLEEQVLALLQSQARQGVLPTSTVFEQQAIASMRAHEVRTAEAAELHTRGELALRLGLASAQGLVLPETLPAWEVPDLEAPALQVWAIAHRADLQVATAAVDQAVAERALQTGGVRTTEPALGLAGTREAGGDSLKGLALQLTLPVFDTGQARLQLADAQVAQAKFGAESLRRQASLEVESALASLIIARLAVGHADHHLLQQEQLEHLARQTYEQGVSDLLSYRQASLLRLASALDRLQTQQMFWMAVIALERATGIAGAMPTNP